MARAASNRTHRPPAPGTPIPAIPAIPTDQDYASGFVELGDLGLKRYTGFIAEEWLRSARGIAGQRLIAEMRDNHPVIGAILFAIRMLVRQVSWNVEAASDKPADVLSADFVQSCLDDMTASWQDTLTEILSFIEFGWSYFEHVYKVRQGPQEEDGALRSRFTDKKIGWRKIALRSQDTLLRWELDASGGVMGMHQTPPLGGTRYIPINRSLLFRASSFKSNPEGRSVLRNVIVPYQIQKKLQEIEAIGAERDLAGLPVIYAPSTIMKQTATPAEQALFASLKSIVRNVKRDSQEGLIMPSDTDKQGKPLYELKLLSSPGTRQFDVNKIIERYDQRITASVLADFIMLGQGSSDRGSYALSKNKTDMFTVALGAWLDSICEVFNRFAIPRLLTINNMPVDDPPQLQHGDIETPDLAQLAQYVQFLAQSGMPLFPDPNLEKHLRDVAGLPDADPDILTIGTGAGDRTEEITPVVKPQAAKPVAQPVKQGGGPSQGDGGPGGEGGA